MKKIKLISLMLCTLLCSLCFVFVGCDDKNKFSLNFMVDDEIYSTIATCGNEIISLPSNPTKSGYDFDGWYWDNNTWEQPFTINSLLDIPLSSDLKIYSKWNVVQYTASFYADNNLIATRNFTIENSEINNLPVVPNKVGYNGAWEDYTIEANNLTINAKYTIKTFTVIWKNYDNSVLQTDIDVEYGATVNYRGATPIKPSTSQCTYTFNGWSPNTNTINDNTIFVAQFTENPINSNIFNFTQATNKFDTNNSIAEVTNSVLNEKSESFDFTYSNYKSVLGRWGQLNDYGYFFNKDLIKGINSLTIETLDSNDKFIVSFGYKKINDEIIFSDSVEYTSGNLLTLVNDCNFIKVFNPSSNNIIINKIILKYKDIESSEINKNDASYTYTINQDKISCKITGITNKENVKNIYLSNYYQGYKITNIEDGAFSQCSLLESLSIPFISMIDTANGSYEQFIGRLFGTVEYDNATRIIQTYSYLDWNSSFREYSCAFYVPTNLRIVHIEGGYCNRSLWGFTTVTKVSFGNSIAKIGHYCCNGCSSLQIILFGETASEIGLGSFRYCSNLSSLNLISNISKISSQAFDGCSFTDLIIPDNVTTLSEQAFYGCNITNNIYISKSVTSVGDTIFNYIANSSLKPTIYCEAESVSSWSSNWNQYDYPVIYGYYNNIDNYLVCSRNDKYSLVEFNGQDEKIINTLNDDIEIENYALYSNLFTNYNLMEMVILSKKCDSVLDNAFVNCENLKYVIIKNGNISINQNAFSGTNSIECLYFDGDINDWTHTTVYNNYTIAFFSEVKISDISQGIYYWHYVNGIPTINL